MTLQGHPPSGEGKACLRLIHDGQEVFYDERALLIDDEEEEGEERFVMLGMSFSLRILLVCHSYREDDSVIRIVSARKADRTERAQYERRWKR